ncbi:MAG: hypothetical protein FWD38_11400 [Oscillospiraceae bacterium]|nr:hypothetical protein [Oscillospiraceae bacterium]
MKQRWDEHNKPSGLLNITINDIIFDTSDKVKHNILKVCNECSYNGFIKNKEFASLLNAKTGEPLEKCHLLEGKKDEVDISKWEMLLKNNQPFSLIIIHNHTIETLFSFDDLYTFISHISLRASIVTAGEFAYIIEKSEMSELNWELIEQEFINQFPGENHFKTDDEWDINKLADFWKIVLKEFHIDFRRWA